MSFLAPIVPFIAPAMMGASAIMSGIQGLRQGQTQAQLFKYQGQSELAAGAAAADRQQTIERARLGQLHAQIGASGTTMAGSPMMVYMDSVKNAALNVQDKIYQGKLGAWQSGIQATMAQRAGQNALWGGLLSGASRLGMMYLSPGSTLLGNGYSGFGGSWSDPYAGRMTTGYT